MTEKTEKKAKKVSELPEIFAVEHIVSFKQKFNDIIDELGRFNAANLLYKERQHEDSTKFQKDVKELNHNIAGILSTLQIISVLGTVIFISVVAGFVLVILK